MVDKRIVDILVPLSGKGGVENVINMVSDKLIKSGYRVRVVQMVYTGPKWVGSGIEFYPVLVNKKVDNVEDFVGMYAEFMTVHGKPDVVIATPWPFMAYVARAALKSLGLESVKVAAWLHAPVKVYKDNGTGGMECLSFADCTMVLTRKAVKQIKEVLPEHRVELVGNPVDMTGIEPLSSWNLDNRTLLYVGRISREKRMDVIIDAMTKTQSMWKLRVIGDGDELASCKERAEYSGVSDFISWQGWKNNPWEDYNDVTALVLASDYEGFSLVAVEALTRGIPVISPPVDGIGEYIVPGVNGYFYSQGDSSELAMVLDALAGGILPAVVPENCVKSVAVYEKEKVLTGILDVIESLMDS